MDRNGPGYEPTEFRIDAVLPPEMARKAEAVGVSKCELDTLSTLVLAILAGAFIAFGAVFSTVVTVGTSEVLGYGVTRLLAGIVFSLGLILVVVAGAELFTGNNLIVMAWAGGKVPTSGLLRNWCLVYFGNLIGAIGVAVLVLLSGQFAFCGGSVGTQTLTIAATKLELGFGQAFVLGVLCNILVCLAVWLTLSARSAGEKMLAVVPPITAFVAAGFEHCIANMYFVPIALLIKDFAPIEFWNAAELTPTGFESLTWSRFLISNLLPVTLGNILGGAVLVGMVYWFIYLRKRLTGGSTTNH